MTNIEDILQLVRLNDQTMLRSVRGNYDPAALNEEGQSLMHEAAAYNSHECAFELIDAGCPLNLQDKNGQTALHYAAANSSFDVAKILIESGADLSLKDKYGNESLWTATFNARGNYQLINIFTKDASPDNKNKSGRSPLGFAKQIGDEDLIKILESI